MNLLSRIKTSYERNNESTCTHKETSNACKRVISNCKIL